MIIKQSYGKIKDYRKQGTVRQRGIQKILGGDMLKAVLFSISLKATEENVMVRTVIKNESFSMFLGGTI